MNDAQLTAKLANMDGQPLNKINYLESRDAIVPLIAKICINANLATIFTQILWEELGIQKRIGYIYNKDNQGMHILADVFLLTVASPRQLCRALVKSITIPFKNGPKLTMWKDGIGWAVYSPNDGSVTHTLQHQEATEASLDDWSELLGMDLGKYWQVPCMTR